MLYNSKQDNRKKVDNMTTLNNLIDRYFDMYLDNNEKRRRRAEKADANDWYLGILEGRHDTYLDILLELRSLRQELNN